MLIGHESIIKYFEGVISSGRMAHAYAFCGPENIGKKTTAIYIAQNIFCEETSEPLHKRKTCTQCSTISKETHQNVLFLREDSGTTKGIITIDQIRDLRKKLIFKDIAGRKRLIIIEDAENLNHEAANAFLKLLEEPYPNIAFILIAKSASSLSPTIASRVQIIRFNTISDVKIEKSLVAGGVEAKTAKEMTFLAYGRPGRALLFNQYPDLFERAKEIAKTSKFFTSEFISERLKLPVLIRQESRDAIVQINGWILALEDALKIQLRKSDRRVVDTARIINGLLNLSNLAKNTNINIRLAVEKIIFENGNQFYQ